jgi:hypothetical protein
VRTAKLPADVAKPAVQPAYLRQKDAACYVGIAKALLGRLERDGLGPKKIRKGRAALYGISDLDVWMTQSEVKNAR